MSADPAPAPARPADAHPPRRRQDTEGWSQSGLECAAERLADGMRRDVRSCSRFERRLHVLDLLHRDPQLLAEVVLYLAEQGGVPAR